MPSTTNLRISNGEAVRGPTGRRLFAVSDLHVTYEQNRAVVKDLHPSAPSDWLIVAGDIGELTADVEWALRLLAERFAQVVWVPGNHELWTHPDDPVRLRGEACYSGLVELCRPLGVLTPEDPYAHWPGPDGPVVIAPLFLLYDYSFLLPGATGTADALAGRGGGGRGHRRVPPAQRPLPGPRRLVPGVAGVHP